MPSLRQQIPALLFGLISIVASFASAADTAPIMPLASQSLLLDICTAGEKLVVAGERGHILYSQNQGLDWVQGNVPTTQMLTAVYFADSTHGWAVGHDGLILASDDSGKNWRIQRDGLAVQQQSNLELRELSLRHIEELQGQIEQAGEDVPPELALQLEDARYDLEDAELALAEDVFTAPLLDVWFQDREKGWATGAFGTLLQTNDGGRHWTDISQKIDNPDEFHLNSITGDGQGRIFIAGEGGVLYRSEDSGTSWTTLPHVYDGSWFGVLYHPDSQALLVFGLQGNIFRSEDFGDSFTVVPNDNHITLAGGSVSRTGTIVITGGVGLILRSSNAGKSFQTSSLRDGLSLSSGIEYAGKLILVGQGGVKLSSGDQ